MNDIQYFIQKLIKETEFYAKIVYSNTDYTTFDVFKNNLSRRYSIPTKNIRRLCMKGNFYIYLDEIRNEFAIMEKSSMDIRTLKILLEQIDVYIDKYRINSISEKDRVFSSGMEQIRQIIKDDIEML